MWLSLRCRPDGELKKTFIIPEKYTKTKKREWLTKAAPRLGKKHDGARQYSVLFEWAKKSSSRQILNDIH